MSLSTIIAMITISGTDTMVTMVSIAALQLLRQFASQDSLATPVNTGTDTYKKLL